MVYIRFFWKSSRDYLTFNKLVAELFIFEKKIISQSLHIGMRLKKDKISIYHKTDIGIIYFELMYCSQQ